MRRELAGIIRRCLQADPRERYPDAGTLLAELRRVGESFARPGEGVSSPSARSPRRSRRVAPSAGPVAGRTASTRAVGRGRKTLHLTGSAGGSAVAGTGGAKPSPGWWGRVKGIFRLAHRLVVGLFILLLVLISIWVILYLPGMRGLPGTGP